jgi:16S rRNA (guanine966-N2)-methyltransferase
MRIVGGENKGRRIKVPKKGIRPTKGIVRGAIFNIIGGRINNANILDIFAGSGALGLEAISRGAKSCIFIEKKPKFLFENIKYFSCHDKKIEVIIGDFRLGLRKLKGKEFDIIFVDPPYQRNYIQTTLNLISKNQFLKESGMIVAEHHYEKRLSLPEGFSILKKKKYGDTVVSFINKN